VVKKTNDKDTSKKTFTNLDTLGSINSCWNNCCMDGCAEEGDAGIVTEASIGNVNTNTISRYFKDKVK
jgi:hypothetical protein